ncbi:Katanin p80 WD40 repeat-containing subunit B1-like protein [Tribolium castaneum]|uniref:Katanin p80 WD40 repeat-containing subunit B1 n=1 Tax=Tribolium castaneum TaxID=7070 RepID=A0A139WIM1_TRICA|nr:PREDICTED: katanin p80 WD40 repeat-containing subunit B1 [Tribolium castaneum]KYB27617.1 Katanin p80 WD40 repeat-containing subunit B1-like protein [Tribolium castaneum]|eukprot:XP_015835530.1 PREDICTED: katanin p80 WD40 repeat-containing subunit B1 [Tribolium castaneum]
MATPHKKSWKLQELMAHDAKVNCLSLGHKSGRVMVTGGDDMKVNLWAIGKHTCFMILSGHTTPIECVQFNQFEELVCAGSRAGALKVWDLEAAKLVRTLNGHKSALKCVDFHPYGDFLASGSSDCSIKMWDSRKKGCIYTYNGHKATINSLKFSPDGHWIASGGDDATVKIWDLRVGKVLKDFGEHLNSVTCVEFHPHEFLLASGSADRSVQFYDLENFSVVSSERDLGLVRCLCFNPDGERLFVGLRDYLKVVGWEPNRLFDSVMVNWSGVADISIAQNQLVGASFHLTNVQVYVVDLNKVHPLNSSTETPPSPFTPNQSIRKSFSKAERPVSLKNRSLDVKTIEESTSGTDPEEESTAEVTNLTDYNEIFKGRGLTRTPPPLEQPEPFQRPEHDYSDPTEPQILAEIPTDNFEALSLDNNINCYSPPPAFTSSQYSRSKSNLDQVYVSRLTKQQDRENNISNINKNKNQLTTPRYYLQRQSSCKDVPENAPKANNSIIKHSVSDANISKSSISSRNSSRKNSFSRPSRNSTSVPNVSKIPSARNSEKVAPVKTYITPTPEDVFVSSKLSPDSPSEEVEFVPMSMDRPAGLDLDDFLPKNHRTLGFEQQLPDMSEAEVLGALVRGHEPMMAMLVTRQRSLKVVLAQLRSKDIKTATETAVVMGDLAVLVDLLGVFNCKYTLWNLDLCVLILPKIQELLQSKFETYVTTGCNTLKLILKHFGPVIKSNVQSPVGSFGVDIPREERYNKSVKCHEVLQNLRTFLVKKQSMPGSVGSTFREISTLIQNTFD